ncbi:MAG: hypothetical protein IIY42_02755 [Ruminococcus sp.]|nr:hypothetical protein [Ruminococcus sp.]
MRFAVYFPYAQQLLAPSKRKVTGISTEPVLTAGSVADIVAVILSASRLSISDFGPMTVTLIFFEVTSALYAL